MEGFLARLLYLFDMTPSKILGLFWILLINRDGGFKLPNQDVPSPCKAAPEPYWVRAS